MDHRRGKALAQLNEIEAKRHISQSRRGEVTLNGGDRHDPVVRVPEVSPGLLGLNLAGAMHQHARNDLETVGNPMLHLLQKDCLLSNEIVFLPGLGASKSDVSYRQ